MGIESSSHTRKAFLAYLSKSLSKSGPHVTSLHDILCSASRGCNWHLVHLSWLRDLFHGKVSRPSLRSYELLDQETSNDGPFFDSTRVVRPE